MKYSVIIPTYNRLDLLQVCLTSIIKYTPDLQEKFEVIIVSNGCADGTAEFVKSLNTEKEIFKVVYWNKPIGYAKAINMGIAVSQGEYLILLNNDCRILAPDWVELLEEPFLKYKNVGLSGPAGWDRTNIPWLIFFCVMIKRELITEIGYLSEEYGLGGGEDTEYCLKAYYKGYTNYMVPLKSGGLKLKGTKRTRLFPIYHAGGSTCNTIEEMPSITKRNTERLELLFGP